MRAQRMELFRILALTLSMLVAFPMPTKAEFDPSCVRSEVMNTTRGYRLVSVPNPEHPIVKKFLMKDGKRIEQNKIRPLKRALGLKTVSVAGYFDCDSCGNKKISAHERDQDASGQLSCACGASVSSTDDIFYEAFDEDNAVPIDRLVLDPQQVANLSGKPMIVCEYCGDNSFDDRENCGSCGAEFSTDTPRVIPKTRSGNPKPYRAVPVADKNHADLLLNGVLVLTAAIFVAGVFFVAVKTGVSEGGWTAPSNEGWEYRQDSSGFDWDFGSSGSDWDYGSGSDFGDSGFGSGSGYGGGSDYGGGGGVSNGNGSFDY